MEIKACRCGGEGRLVVKNKVRQEVAVQCRACGAHTEFYFAKHLNADDKGVQNAVDDWNNWKE